VTNKRKVSTKRSLWEPGRKKGTGGGQGKRGENLEEGPIGNKYHRPNISRGANTGGVGHPSKKRKDFQKTKKRLTGKGKVYKLARA